MRFARLAAATIVTASLVAACGNTPQDATESTTVTTATPVVTGAPVADTAAANPDKPVVEIPKELPTELVITDLTEGTGTAAKEGDTVVVNYVGVRSADGTEFDNSYDRGQPLDVVLGAGGVIQGWDEGLVGIKVGGRRQLDIPSDLAYGDADKGDIIKAGDALSFVVEAVAIVPGLDPADDPKITMKATDNVAELLIDDLIVGDGAEIADGETAVLALIAYRADTGELLNSSWDTGQTVSIPFDPTAGVLPGLVEGLDGMKVGGRRQLNIPFEPAFGAEGSESLGLPANVDLILILDLIAIV